jgi:hypothetical protein
MQPINVLPHAIPVTRRRGKGKKPLKERAPRKQRARSERKGLTDLGRARKARAPRQPKADLLQSTEVEALHAQHLDEPSIKQATTPTRREGKGRGCAKRKAVGASIGLPKMFTTSECPSIQVNDTSPTKTRWRAELEGRSMTHSEMAAMIKEVYAALQADMGGPESGFEIFTEAPPGWSSSPQTMAGHASDGVGEDLEGDNASIFMFKTNFGGQHLQRQLRFLYYSTFIITPLLKVIFEHSMSN